MGDFLCDVALFLVVVGYLSSVASCASSVLPGSSWAEPWVMGALLPVIWVADQCKTVAGVLASIALFIGGPACVVWLFRTVIHRLGVMS